MWGTRTNPINKKWIHVTDENGARVSCSGGISPLRRIYLAFFDTGAVKSHCPYTGELPVMSLMEGLGRSRISPSSRPDRVVFYGGSLEGAQDKTYTPVNGLLPSVFVHAMALDNLITFQGRPEQNVITAFGTTIPSNPAQMMAIVPVILILALIHLRRMRRKRARAQIQEHSVTFEYVVDKTIETVWHYFAFALALGIGLLLALAVGLSTANWVEVVFVSVGLAAMLLVGVPESIWGYLHHVAGGVAQTEDEREETSS